MERSARKMLDFIKTDDCFKAGHCSFSISMINIAKLPDAHGKKQWLASAILKTTGSFGSSRINTVEILA